MMAVNPVVGAPFASTAATNALQVDERKSLEAAITDLYGVIAVLDSAQQSDFAGRLHSLTLELRERVSYVEREQ
jgi:hypothetical protein